MLTTYIKHAIVDSAIRAVFDGVISNFKPVDVNSLEIGKTYALIRIARSIDPPSDWDWKYCIHDYQDVVLDSYDGVEYSGRCYGNYYAYTDDITLYRRRDVIHSWNTNLDHHITIDPRQIILNMDMIEPPMK